MIVMTTRMKVAMKKTLSEIRKRLLEIKVQPQKKWMMMLLVSFLNLL